MSDTLIIGVLVLTGTIGGPLLLAWLTGQQRRREKQEDYARQDEVAARLEERDRKAAKVADATLKTLRVVHTLVNSDMTAALEGQLSYAESLVVLMRQVAGSDPGQEAADAITVLEGKIVEQRAALADRAKQAATVDAQTADAEEADDGSGVTAAGPVPGP